jgi:carbonic anhydrase
VSITDQLLDHNAAVGAGCQPRRLPLPPAKRVAVLACMDARLSVDGILGQEGAHVVSNASRGGERRRDWLVADLPVAVRDRGEIVLIPHTDGGMLTFGEDEVKAASGRRRGLTLPFALEAFVDLDRGVGRAVARIRRGHWCRTSTPSAASSARLHRCLHAR